MSADQAPTVAELSDTTLVALARSNTIALTTAALDSLDRRRDRDGELSHEDIARWRNA